MRLPLLPPQSPERVRQMAPLELAFVGDSVHMLLTRILLCDRDRRPSDLQRLSSLEVNANAQAAALGRILPSLTAEEQDIVRRGRNAHARHSAPRSSTPDAYCAATALEALYGYLFLTGQSERLEQLDQIGRGKE